MSRMATIAQNNQSKKKNVSEICIKRFFSHRFLFDSMRLPYFVFRFLGFGFGFDEACWILAFLTRMHFIDF